MKTVIFCKKLSQGKMAFRTGLLVFTLILLAVQGYGQSVEIESFERSRSITNRDVIEMLKAGLGSRVVAAKISSSACKFTTSPEAIVRLRKAGADEDVLLAILLKETEQGSVTPVGRGAVEVTPFGVPPSLTNSGVLTMLQGGVTTKVIVAKISASPCSFDTSPQALAELKRAGAEDDLLMAVLKSTHAGL